MFLCALLLIPIFSLNAFVKPNGFFDLSNASKHNVHIEKVFVEKDSKQFVMFILNGIVVNQGGIVTPDGKVCTETETFKKDQHKIIKNGFAHEPIIFEGRLAVISSPGQENWYHWLFQVLPRLIILKESGIAYDKIYLSDFDYEWQKKSLKKVLDFLGISKDKLFLVKGDQVIQAKVLIVPSVPFIPSKSRKIFPGWLKQFLHTVFLHKNLKGIYISRSKASSRRIINEKDFIDLLIKHEFEIIYLEDLDPSEQASLFNKARIVIASHGSGLTNLIFSNPEVKVIEIDHKLDQEEQRSFFKRLTHMVKGHYYPFYTDTVSEDNLDDDLFVDLDHFEKLLKQIM